MALRTKSIWICVILILLSIQRGFGQRRTATDTILVGAVVENNDTIPMIFLPDCVVYGKMAPNYYAKKIAYEHLRYNVFKVYPYAVIAAEVLKDVDSTLAMLPTKRARKKYLKSVEKELNQRFKGELKNMSIEQGQILVKLIDRQTGKNCYHIIKELKGGFNAFVWQSVARIFDNNLKRDYDPYGEDKDMEKIVVEIEDYYNQKYYQYQLQQARLQAQRQASSH